MMLPALEDSSIFNALGQSWIRLRILVDFN